MESGDAAAAGPHTDSTEALPPAGASPLPAARAAAAPGLCFL